MKKLTILLLLSAIVFFSGNGLLCMTNPDEVFYAQTAREMVQLHSWNVPYLFGQPQFEKPILTYWLIRVGYMIFGETNFAARFFPSLFAIIGVIAVYIFACIAFRNQRKAWFAALILMSSGLYVGLGKLVFTDTIFSVFILLALTSFYWAFSLPVNKTSGIILTFLFSALAVLTKGPLGFLIPLLIIISFLLINRSLKFLFHHATLIGLVGLLVISLPWYYFIIKQYGNVFIQEFFYNDHWRRLIEAEHSSNDRWYFYPLTMIGCMFPWSVIVSGGIIYYASDLKKACSQFFQARIFIYIWVAVVFCLFQSAHSKLVSYIVPLFPALAIIAGDFLEECYSKDYKMARQMLLYSIFSILCIPTILLIGLIKYQEYLPPKAEVLTFICFYLTIFITMLVFLKRGKLKNNIYLLVCQVPLLLLIVFLVRGHFEYYATSKYSIDYLLQNYHLEKGSKLFSTKMFLRGTRYYTDMEVAVLTTNGTKFFSQHPVINLDTKSKTVEFFRQQQVTYGFVNKSYWKSLQEMATDNSFRLELLEVMGDQYIVRIWS